MIPPSRVVQIVPARNEDQNPLPRSCFALLPLFPLSMPQSPRVMRNMMTMLVGEKNLFIISLSSSQTPLHKPEISRLQTNPEETHLWWILHPLFLRLSFSFH